MAASQTVLDFSAYTLGGSSFLADIEDVSVMLDTDTADGSGITQAGKMSQALKNFVTVDTGLRSTLSGSTRVANLDVTAFTIGGTSLISYLRGGSIEGTLSHDEASGVGDRWKFPQFVKKELRGTISLTIPTAAVPTFLTGAYSAVSGLDLVLSVTINSVAVTFPALLKTVKHVGGDSKNQMLECTFEGKAVPAAAFPTAPTGTTSLLEKALNAPQTAIAVLLTTKVAGGISYSGNFLFSSFSFSFNDSSVITNRYTLASQGAITGTATV